MNVAVIGYGLIGRERVRALVHLRDVDHLVTSFGVFDPFAVAERSKVEALGGRWFESLAEVKAFAPAWVVVATPHDAAVRLCAEVLPWGTRVLLEKPFGRTLAEAEQLAAMACEERQIWIGLNYRFFPGIAAALNDARLGMFGELISVNMTLGHGGSPGMEKGWKFDPVKAGGGCLIDPGIHLLDLCLCLAPHLGVVNVKAWSGFWKTGIEEEAHILLQSGKTVFNVQVSIVRWRSVFRLDINGTDGYGIVTGRGRSYGPMKYIRGKRWGWQYAENQEASEQLVSTSDCNSSFVDEMTALFCSDTAGTLWTPGSADEGLRVMRTYQACRNVMQLEP